MNFIEIADIMFKNKHRYSSIRDDDKINNFYIINKKCLLYSKEKSKEFNHKSIDRSSALDLWFLELKKFSNIPGWWFLKSNSTTRKESSIPKLDKELIQEYQDLNDSDIDFLLKHNKTELDSEIKILKKF